MAKRNRKNKVKTTSVQSESINISHPEQLAEHLNNDSSNTSKISVADLSLSPPKPIINLEYTSSYFPTGITGEMHTSNYPMAFLFSDLQDLISSLDSAKNYIGNAECKQKLLGILNSLNRTCTNFEAFRSMWFSLIDQCDILAKTCASLLKYKNSCDRDIQTECLGDTTSYEPQLSSASTQPTVDQFTQTELRNASTASQTHNIIQSASPIDNTSKKPITDIKDLSTSLPPSLSPTQCSSDSSCIKNLSISQKSSSTPSHPKYVKFQDQVSPIQTKHHTSSTSFSSINPKPASLIVYNINHRIDEKDILHNIKAQFLSDSNAQFLIQKKFQSSKHNCYNLVIKSSHESVMKIISLQYIYIFQRKYKVKPFVHLIRCFRCHVFGHVAKYCTNNVVCANCGDSHSSNDCNNSSRCINCFHYNRVHQIKFNTNHTTYAKACNSFRKYTRKLQQSYQELSFSLNASRTSGYVSMNSASTLSSTKLNESS